MKYFSVDLETTKQDPKKEGARFEDILQLSIVVDDLSEMKPLPELDHLTVYIKRPFFTGSPGALAFNSDILQCIHSEIAVFPVVKEEMLPEGETSLTNFIVEMVREFIFEHKEGAINEKSLVAGKNYGVYDDRFLPSDITELFSHRVLDVGVLFADLSKNQSLYDSYNPIPSLSDALRVNVEHDAYSDALLVCRGVRQAFASHSDFEIDQEKIQYQQRDIGPNYFHEYCKRFYEVDDSKEIEKDWKVEVKSAKDYVPTKAKDSREEAAQSSASTES